MRTKIEQQHVGPVVLFSSQLVSCYRCLETHHVSERRVSSCLCLGTWSGTGLVVSYATLCSLVIPVPTCAILVFTVFPLRYCADQKVVEAHFSKTHQADHSEPSRHLRPLLYHSCFNAAFRKKLLLMLQSVDLYCGLWAEISTVDAYLQ